MRRTSNSSRSHSSRGVLLVALLLALIVMLVSAGGFDHEPKNNTFADERDFGADPGAYVGDKVSASGTVVSTDPIVVEVAYGERSTLLLSVRDSPVKATEGDEFRVFGTLLDARTIVADRAHLRSPWEIWYMYLVSFVGVVWVVGRGLRHWKISPSRRGLVPRSGDDA